MATKYIRKCVCVTSWLLVFLISYLNYQKSENKKNVSLITTLKPVLPDPSHHYYLIEETTKCAGNPPFLMLMIPSRPQDVLIRDTLRRTWANESLVEGISIMRLFLLGSSPNQSIQAEVKKESDRFHDIIQQGFLDTYRNLTLKTLMGMEWISRLCPNVSYVMKIDSDMFFNPWLLVRRILQPEKPVKVGFFTGFLVERSEPFRNKSSKWYVPKSVYSKIHYPPYCSGTGYIFSGELAGKINTHKSNIPLFPYEDVFVGMCLEMLGIRISRPSGNWFLSERIEYNRCRFANVITVHHFAPDELLNIWLDFKKAVKRCT